MGTQLTAERGERAWSRLAQRAGFRHCVRVLVFAGAVGTAWLIGSSAASAHSADGQVGVSGHRSGVERGVENNTWRSDELLRQQCTGGSSDLAGPDSRNTGDAKNTEAGQHGSTAKAQHNRNTKHNRNTIDPEPVSQPSACGAREESAAGEAAPGSQASSPDAGHTLEGSEGTATTSADPHGRSASGTADGAATQIPPLGSLAGETLTTATGVVGGDEAVSAAPVSHTAGRATDAHGSPLASALQPVLSTVDTVSRPVTDVLAHATRPVADEVAGDEAPRLGNTVHKLVPLPGAGLSPDEAPVNSAPPVAPGVDLASGKTSPVEAVDAAPTKSKQARHTGPKDAAPASHLPIPVPLPAVPGSGVSYGNATGSQFSQQQGGGMTATVTGLPISSAPESSALLATAYQAALRDLAGEPAVSPD